jgi:ABC-2 type transport system permease protein
MSARRLLEVFRLDFFHHLRRPLFWILLVLLAFTAWGLSTGHVRIATGDSDVGGVKAWITSQYSMARVLSAVVLLFYGFFVAVAAGMTVIKDEEFGIGGILHSTPLSAGEYVWGKFLAVVSAFLLVLALEIAMHVFANHALVTAKSAEFVGPLVLANYLVPALVFCLPVILFYAGTSFALGAILRRPILVFFLPVVVLLACGFFLWSWSPSWLDPRINRALMLIDPAGLRWLTETWLKVDRGVRFYNEQPIGLDTGFVISRIAFAALGLGAVLLAQRHFVSVMRGRESSRSKKTVASEPEALPAGVRPGDVSLAALAMTSRAPGFLASFVEVARVELRELRSQAGLYLFAPLILLQTIGSASVAVGPFETPLLATSGTLASSSLNTLTLLVTLLLLFYMVISLEREQSRRLADIHHATPVSSAAVLLGKTVANSLVGVVILLAAFLGCALVLVIQGKPPVELAPFAIVWGGMLLPTLILWCAFVAAMYSITRNGFATWGICLAAWAATLLAYGLGHMNWVGNWCLWDVAGSQEGSRWSDLGPFELVRRELVTNRLFALSLAAFFLALALRFHPRRSSDATSTLMRLRPFPLFLSVARFAPWGAMPLVLGIASWIGVRSGFEGEYAKKTARDYRAKNIETYKDYPVPSITGVDLDLSLEPARRGFRSRGTLTLLNDRPSALRRIPVTSGFHWEKVTWTLAGEEAKPENRAGLYVFQPQKPLAPGESLTLGFDIEGAYPKGATENGGGAMEFILPSGIVLTSFGPQFVPSIGFNEGIGIDEDAKPEAKQFEDDFYVGQTDSGFGNNTPQTTKITVHAPEEYTINSVGTLTHEEVANGVRTVVWESDHPVNFFNVVAGRWNVKRGEGTAIYYYPGHPWNVDEMSTALDGARRWYSEWFRPYPWKELKLSEFPAFSTYAQGFPTNITFSEGIGFLTESDPKSDVAFLVTAHESAHQWWGNILEPGKGPGGNILSEGTAHFSTILLTGEMLGERRRIEFCKRIEERYGDRRQADSERPLVKIDGSRPGDTTVTYDKGGWVFWMLSQAIGRERMLAGCQEFIRRFEKGPDHPVLQDFVAVVREFAPDPAVYDAFVKQWFFEVAVPKYELSDAARTSVAASDGSAATWEVRVTVTNAGTGTMPLEISAERGERFPDDAVATEHKPQGDVVSAAGHESEPKNTTPFRESRTTIVLGPGEKHEVLLRCDFEPERVLVDPDAHVLQLERKAAIVRF